MNIFLLDASALAKRFVTEAGTLLLNHLFTQTGKDRRCCLMLGAAEVAATLARKRNGGKLTPSLFALAMTELRQEVLTASDFRKLPCNNAVIEASIPFSDSYALNSHDAVVLQVAVETAAELQMIGHSLVLVSADARLLRAAQAEGLQTFNPETQPQADLDALIAA
jgi:uncharacterized protein